MVYDSAMKQSYSVAQLRSVLLYLSIGLLTLCALLGILAVLSQEIDWRILFTTFCAAIASLIAMSNISRLTDNRIVIKFYPLCRSSSMFSGLLVCLLSSGISIGFLVFVVRLSVRGVDIIDIIATIAATTTKVMFRHEYAATSSRLRRSLRSQH